MSNPLNWRTATNVVLNEELIPNPNAEHVLLDRLHNVRIALDNGFLHIDPRQPSERDAAKGQEFTATVVPAAVVHTVTYKANRPIGRGAGF